MTIFIYNKHLWAPTSLAGIKTVLNFQKFIQFFVCLQNTYTNAEKLLAAAEELAHTGECDAEDIYRVAHELEAHVTSFAARVEQRRRRLDLAVLFYTHEKEVSSNF